MDRRRCVALVVAGAVLWGTTGTAQELGPVDDPEVVGAVRVVVGALGLVAVVAVTGGRRQAGAVLRQAPRTALAVAATALAAYQVTFFSGVDRAGVAVGTVVGIGSAPIATGLLAWALDRRRPSPRWALATVLAVAGAGLLLAPGPAAAPGGQAATRPLPSDPGAADPLGIALAVAAGVSYAIFVVASKRVFAASHAPGGAPPGQPLPALAVMFVAAATPFALVLARADLGALSSAGGLALAAWLGLGTVVVGYSCYALGLAGLAPATVATLTLAEPLTAAALGAVLLGERLGARGVGGALLVLVGLVVLAAPARSQQRAAGAGPAG